MSRSHPVPLRRRLLVVTVIVAVVAVLATAVATLQLARSVDVVATRAELAAQAERIAATRPAVRNAAVSGLSALDDSTLIASIDAQGATSGSGSDLFAPRIVRQLREGESVSTTVRRDGVTYLVEAAAIDGGGGVLLAQNAATVRSLIPDLVNRIGLALGIGVVVAAGAAVFASRALARPMVGLAHTARRLADGQRSLPETGTGVRELDDVAEGLTVLDRALERSEGRQREFLLSISHEIRTPLTALRGYAEALADGAVPPDEVSAVGRTMNGEALRLAAFTDDLLALARLEADDFRLDLGTVPLAELLDGAAEAWQATADSAGVALVVDAPAGELRTDPTRLRQVIDGLLENALRVSPPGSEIRITAQRQPEAVVIEVADRGPGIDAADAARAFERGYLRERYARSRPVGTGLGLSIAARLVERMGGTISAHPGDPGSVFRIRLADPGTVAG